MSEIRREEGFWRTSLNETSPLPWPEPDSSWSGREDFLEKLIELEAVSLGMDWMGYSVCRICGCQNGASEYMASGWVWPEGFRHYVSEHGVRPSRDFEQFVLG